MSMNKKASFITCMFVLFSLTGHAVIAATVTYTDGIFVDVDWTSSILTQSGPPASFSAQQIGSGGNPGEYRNTQHTYGGLGDIVVGHWLDGATYDPSTQGAISSIDASFDLILFDGGVSAAVAYGILLTQDGSSYLAGYTLTTIEPVRDMWVHHDLFNLTEDDFIDVLGSLSLPDFSVSGSAIQVGYFTSNGTSGSTSTSTSSGIDNWSVMVNPVPLPAAIWLFSTGIFTLFCYRVFSKKNARNLAPNKNIERTREGKRLFLGPCTVRRSCLPLCSLIGYLNQDYA